ncbi:hypothetical protein V5O48_009206 [Marasmius crinis-equi]|uniref:Ubiquitin-like protease family profile domain-containing protein n=1 Tax=Marasmius crinis-equi TaxID=585013 RepID=A0ABR3FBV4_9AGAR
MGPPPVVSPREPTRHPNSLIAGLNSLPWATKLMTLKTLQEQTDLVHPEYRVACRSTYRDFDSSWARKGFKGASLENIFFKNGIRVGDATLQYMHRMLWNSRLLEVVTLVGKTPPERLQMLEYPAVCRTRFTNVPHANGFPALKDWAGLIRQLRVAMNQALKNGIKSGQAAPRKDDDSYSGLKLLLWQAKEYDSYRLQAHLGQVFENLSAAVLHVSLFKLGKADVPSGKEDLSSYLMELANGATGREGQYAEEIEKTPWARRRSARLRGPLYAALAISPLILLAKSCLMSSDVKRFTRDVVELLDGESLEREDAVFFNLEQGEPVDRENTPAILGAFMKYASAASTGSVEETDGDDMEEGEDTAHKEDVDMGDTSCPEEQDGPAKVSAVPTVGVSVAGTELEKNRQHGDGMEQPVPDQIAEDNSAQTKRAVEPGETKSIGDKEPPRDDDETKQNPIASVRIDIEDIRLAGNESDLTDAEDPDAENDGDDDSIEEELAETAGLLKRKPRRSKAAAFQSNGKRSTRTTTGNKGKSSGSKNQVSRSKPAAKAGVKREKKAATKAPVEEVNEVDTHDRLNLDKSPDRWLGPEFQLRDYVGGGPFKYKPESYEPQVLKDIIRLFAAANQTNVEYLDTSHFSVPIQQSEILERRDAPKPHPAIQVINHDELAKYSRRHLQSLFRESNLIIRGSPIAVRDQEWNEHNIGAIGDLEEMRQVHDYSLRGREGAAANDHIQLGTLQEVIDEGRQKHPIQINCLDIPGLPSHGCYNGTALQSCTRAYQCTRSQFPNLKYPMGVNNWHLLATRHCSHPAHIDTNGYATVIAPQIGAKLFFLLVPANEADDFNKANGSLLFADTEENMENDLGMAVVPVMLRPGDALLMRPCTYHYVVTLDNSLCHGSHFMCASTMTDTCYGILHTFTHWDTITNQDDHEHRATLARMMIFWAQRIVKPFFWDQGADMVEDLPNVKTIAGFLDFLSVYNIIVLGSLLWHERYVGGALEQGIPELYREARAKSETILEYIDQNMSIRLVDSIWHSNYDNADPIPPGMTRVYDIRNRYLIHQVLSLHTAVKKRDERRASKDRHGNRFKKALLHDLAEFPPEVQEEIRQRIEETLDDPSYNWKGRYRDDNLQWAVCRVTDHGPPVLSADQYHDPYVNIRNAAKRKVVSRSDPLSSSGSEIVQELERDVPPPYSEQDMDVDGCGDLAAEDKGKGGDEANGEKRSVGEQSQGREEDDSEPPPSPHKRPIGSVDVDNVEPNTNKKRKMSNKAGKHTGMGVDGNRQEKDGSNMDLDVSPEQALKCKGKQNADADDKLPEASLSKEEKRRLRDLEVWPKLRMITFRHPPKKDKGGEEVQEEGKDGDSKDASDNEEEKTRSLAIQASKPSSSSSKFEPKEVSNIIDVDTQTGLCEHPAKNLDMDPAEIPWFKTELLPPIQDPDAEERVIPDATSPKRGWTVVTKEVAMLDEPRSMINGECITWGTLALQHFVKGQNTSVLGTGLFDRTSRTKLYRHSMSQEFWKRDTWLLPGHVNGNHWVLAIVKPKKSQVLLFESLAMRAVLDQWVATIKTKIRELVSGAIENGKELRYKSLLSLDDWTFHQLEPRKIQTNTRDCGVWVLWVASLVLRGYDYATPDEKYIGEFRKYVADLLRTFPARKSMPQEPEPEDGFEIQGPYTDEEDNAAQLDTSEGAMRVDSESCTAQGNGNAQSGGDTEMAEVSDHAEAGGNGQDEDGKETVKKMRENH